MLAYPLANVFPAFLHAKPVPIKLLVFHVPKAFGTVLKVSALANAPVALLAILTQTLVNFVKIHVIHAEIVL
jgi:hypothetical protein